jgi:uncharacterized protein
MSGEMDKKIQEVADKIVKEFKPEKIILFGSYAWGKPTKDSDVDLFVIKKSAEKRIERQMNLRKILFGNDFPAMDLLVYDPKEVSERLKIKDIFLNRIFKEGKLIYER